MNGKEILAALEKGADFVEAIAPVATILGGPIVATVSAAIQSVSGIATNVQTRINEGKVVLDGNDIDLIERILARIAAANDRLNAAIEQS